MKIVKDHAAAVSISILVGMIYFLPHILGFMSYGATYTPFLTNQIVDEWFYASQARLFLDGDYLMSSGHTFEGVGFPSIMGFAGELILTAMVAAMGVRVSLIVSDFIFPAIVFLVSYLLFLKITRSKAKSNILALAIIPGTNIAVKILNLLSSNQDILPLSFSRMIHPQVTGIFFILYLLSLYLFLEVQTPKRSVLLALLFGLQFYCGFYYWTYSVTLFGIAMAGLALKEWVGTGYSWSAFFKTALRAAYVLACSIAVSWFFFYNLIRFSLVPFSQEIRLRAGQIYTHSPHLFYLLVGALSVLLLLHLHRKIDSFLVYSLSLITANIVVTNHQVITGIAIQNFHYLGYSFLITTIVALGLPLLKKSPVPIGKTAVMLSAAIFLLAAIVLQSSYYGKFSKAYDLEAQDREAMLEAAGWIDENLGKDDIILAHSSYNVLIMALTHAKIYAPTLTTRGSDNESIERWLNAYLLYNVSLEEFSSGLGEGRYTEQKSYLRDIFTMKYRWQDHDKDEMRQRLLREYARKGDSSIQEEISSYKLDYILAGPVERRKFSFNLSEHDFLELVYDQGDVQIFKVDHQ